MFPISSHVVDLRSDWRGDRPKSKEQEGKNEADRDDVDGEAITTEGPATWWQRRATNPSQDETARKFQVLAKRGSFADLPRPLTR